MWKEKGRKFRVKSMKETKRVENKREKKEILEENLIKKERFRNRIEKLMRKEKMKERKLEKRQERKFSFIKTNL